MTLVSSFFSDYYTDADNRSFSQLLAGAMCSPVAASAAAVKPSLLVQGDSKEKSFEKNLGFKQNRPMNLVVANSPMFMVPPGISPSGFFSPVQSPFGMSHQQALAHVTAQAALSQTFMQSQTNAVSLSVPSSESLPQQNQPFTLTAIEPEQPEQSNIVVLDLESPVTEPAEASKALASADKPANDGYNWRKYGQKQVKTSEYPRSYYKCTHSSCPVKKKVERSQDGQITEVVYKGQHNHELPKTGKPAKDSGGDLGGGNGDSPAKLESGQSTEALTTQVHKQSPPVQLYESVDVEEVDEARLRPAEGDDGVEPNPKRRNIEGGSSELGSSHKTVSESRIVVQTRSEVDLLDDGYKWRKYGQKVVKGNPHPRSYYKCTFAGCNVRKHVERASADPKAVVTSYEGKHNHDVPPGRNCGPHINAGLLKPQKVVARRPATLNQETDFSKDQLQVVLPLKEEQTLA
jgi:hypothetical protein